MNTKHQVISGIIGGIVGSIITALVVSSGTAQRDKFGDIECTSLRVVNENGNPVVMLVGNNMMTNSGAIHVLGKDSGSPRVEINSNEVVILRHTGFVLARIVGNDDGGGLVQVNRSGSAAGVRIENGKIEVYGDRGILGEERVHLGISEYGGYVSADGKDGQSMAILGIHEHGGFVVTRDKLGNMKALD